MLTAAAVTGILSVPGGYAFADADAIVTDSAGTLLGGIPQSPVDGPVNVCGSIGGLDPIQELTAGCVTVGDEQDAQADSPDPDCSEPDGPEPDAPQPEAPEPRAPQPDPPAPQHHEPVVHEAHTLPVAAPQLAETGGDPTTLVAGGLGAVLLAGGGILYRRGRAAARR
ncbi:chaplin family protein [Streptomyces sulfonofaciens]|nr:chaplin family protein [Streptomyces sulfonofaciens]